MNRLNECPFWPRFLSRETAALYLGVSVDTFDDELRAGLWPPPLRRGPRATKLTWDRLVLDAAADRISNLSATGNEAGGNGPNPVPPSPATDAADLRRRIHATFAPKRGERRAH